MAYLHTTAVLCLLDFLSPNRAAALISIRVLLGSPLAAVKAGLWDSLGAEGQKGCTRLLS